MIHSDTLNWDIFNESFAKYYSDEGRPPKPIRLMVGLLLLKQLETYIKEIKEHRIKLRFFSHSKKIKKARAAMKR